MQFFFCDVFDVPDISSVQDKIKNGSIVNVSNKTFDEKMLVDDNDVKENLLYHLIWRLLFGIRATKIHAFEYATGNGAYTFDALLLHMKTSSFYKFGFINTTEDEC